MSLVRKMNETRIHPTRKEEEKQKKILGSKEHHDKLKTKVRTTKHGKMLQKQKEEAYKKYDKEQLKSAAKHMKAHGG